MRYSLIMTLAKRRAFVEDGVVILPKLVPQELCRAAEEAIEATETENVGDSEPVQALYHGSPLCALLQELLGGETLPVTGAQIAVRHPTPPELLDIYMGHPTPSPSDWNGHVDGIAIHPGPHKDDPDREAPIMSFSCLVGVALNDQAEPDGGNFTVLRTGDAVLAHYLACHGESRHAGKEPRKMVFFRIRHHRHTEYRPGEHHTSEMQHMTAVLSDPWLEWEGLGV